MCHYKQVQMKIKAIQSRWVFDSRGNPTIEVDVTLQSGAFGRASIPSGKSIGGAEALELRDAQKQFYGLGVSKALNGIQHRIAPVLIGMDASHQEAIDARLCSLDGTVNKKRLGSNSLLAVSLAVAKAAAMQHRVPFYRYVARLSETDVLKIPMPMLNIINGGAHAEAGTDIQEYMIVPTKAADIYTALRMGSEIYHSLGEILIQHKYSTGTGDEGGYIMHNARSNSLPFELIKQAVIANNYGWGTDVTVAIDVAANQLYRGGRYHLKAEQREYGVRGMRDWYGDVVKRYPISSIEDPYNDEAWSDWQQITKRYGEQLMIVADDITATNVRRIRKAISCNAANTVVIKPNQIGTLTQTIDAVQLAKSAGWQIILSHRSGETEDSSLAHLAVGLAADFIKAGAIAHGERTAKYNELLRISESMGSGAL